MARPLRVELPGGLYLVTARSLPRQRLFRDGEEVGDFLSRLPDLAEAFGVVCHGFCLLPSHYHLLLETPQANLSRALHRLNAGYTSRVNARRRRKGPLLRSRYRSLVVGDEWLVPLSVHVHLNPVRGRLTADPWSYPGSSARAYGPGCEPVPGLVTGRVLALAGGRPAYVQRVEAALRDPPPPPWPQVWRQTVLGGEELRRRVLEAVGDRDLREVSGFGSRPEGLSPAQVVDWVAEQTGVPVAQLTSGKFQRVLARKAAIYLARKLTGATLREIGELFGVDYTTVHMAVRRVEELRARDGSLDGLLVSLEEGLRQLGAGGSPPVPEEGREAPGAEPGTEPETGGAPEAPAPTRTPRPPRTKKRKDQLDLF